MTNKYYYLVMTQQDFLKNQVMEEIIRERTNYYITRKDCLNFWIVMSPSFLADNSLSEKITKTNFYKQKKNELEYKNKIYSAAILSTDYDYICWLKLRLGYFENITIQESLNESFRSDGIYGILEEGMENSLNPFESVKNNLHPNILLNKYKKSIETYYSFQ